MGLSSSGLEPRTDFETSRRDCFKGLSFAHSGEWSASGFSIRAFSSPNRHSTCTFSDADPDIIAGCFPESQRKHESSSDSERHSSKRRIRILPGARGPLRRGAGVGGQVKCGIGLILHCVHLLNSIPCPTPEPASRGRGGFHPFAQGTRKNSQSWS